MSLLEKAIALAVEKHAGQTDKSGETYILHPLRLMMKFTETQEQIVAVLHDVVEDSDVTFQDLLDMGFSEDIVDALDCLTKRDGESYTSFISRIASNFLATKVKMADLQDNMNLLRIDTITSKDLERQEKYHLAYRRLQAVPKAA